MAARAPRRAGPRRASSQAVLALAAALAGCVAGGEARDPMPAAAEPAPVTYESRTGVPLLMDLPLVGWLFQRRVTVR